MKPEHRLIGIIGAMDSELETLLAAMTEKKQETLYGLTFTSGTLPSFWSRPGSARSTLRAAHSF